MTTLSEYFDVVDKATAKSQSPSLDKANLHLITLSHIVGLYTEEEANCFIQKVHKLGESDDTATKTEILALQTGNLVFGGAVEAGKAVGEAVVDVVEIPFLLAATLREAKKNVSNAIKAQISDFDKKYFKQFRNVKDESNEANETLDNTPN